MTLSLIALVAAIVNGALGYGFSSITVPIALLFLANRILNPALVLVEVFMNLFVLWVNRDSIPRVAPKLKMILVGLAPGILIGSLLLRGSDVSWIKFVTYGVLLPLLFFQVAGIRRKVAIGGPIGLLFGGGVGVLYSLTTISGPPLALLFNNEGMEREEFRAALGIVRVFESTITAIVYFSLGMITMESVNLLPFILPSVLVGIPIGAYMMRRVNPEIFRRICMSFDTLIVAFGLSRVVQELGIIRGPAAYSILIASAALDGHLLIRFCRKYFRPIGE